MEYDDRPVLFFDERLENGSRTKQTIQYAKDLHKSKFYGSISMYLHGFEKCALPDINKRSTLGESREQAET